jgi:hypothetical protein
LGGERQLFLEFLKNTKYKGHPTTNEAKMLLVSYKLLGSQCEYWAIPPFSAPQVPQTVSDGTMMSIVATLMTMGILLG